MPKDQTPDCRRPSPNFKQYEQENQAVYNTFQTIVILPLLALAFKKQGRVDDALSTLERAVDLAEPGGWIQPFLEIGPPIAGLLNQLRSRGVAREYVSRILSAFPEGAVETAPELPSTAAGDRPPTPALVEPLTNREREILRLLATSLSAGEIAAELVVSVATVHTHSKNIYGKLDVHSRIQAVERAQELGLI